MEQSLEFTFQSKEFTSSHLIRIFQIFCKAYQISYDDERHGEQLRCYGLDKLNSREGLDFRPIMNAKFFGRCHGDSFTFNGYNGNFPCEGSAEIFKQRGLEYIIEQQQ